jgi:hypothetical protein
LELQGPFHVNIGKAATTFIGLTNIPFEQDKIWREFGVPQTQMLELPSLIRTANLEL